MIRLINLVLSCERVVLICGCCTAHLRPQEGITWPLIEQHLELRTAEVESSMHSYTNYCASTHSTRLHMLLGSQVKFTWIQMLMSQSHSTKNTFGRILKRCQVHLTVYSQALNIFWSDTQIMTLMLFASLSGLLKHGCVKSPGIRVCAVCHALKLFRQT